MGINKQAAYGVIHAELRRLRKLSYSELATLIGKPDSKGVLGEDGKTYQVEIQAVLDDKKAEDLRVRVSADDFGWRAFVPIFDDFIMRPNGTFVGEPPADC